MSAHENDTKALSDNINPDEATQRNTPRQSPVKNPEVNDKTEDETRSDSVPHTPPHSISPQNESVRIPGVPTVISWSDSQHQEHVLGHDVASALIQYDIKPKNTAFFRIRVKISQTSRRNPKHIFLFCPPEHIKSLSIHDDNEPLQLGLKTKAAIRGAVGTAGVVSLSFEMRKPCLLVGPKDLDASSPPNQQNNSSRFVNMLDTVKLLSLQKTFVVCLPRTAASQSALLAMCQAVSSPGLLTSDPTLNDINGLYRGRGGVIIPTTPVNQFDLESTGPDDELPPYSEPAGPAPQLESACSSKEQQTNKRRRTVSSDSSSAHVTTSSKRAVTAEELPTDDMLNLIMGRLEQGFGQINTRITDLEARIGGIESRLDQLEEARSSREGPLDEPRLDDLRYDLEKQIGELREEAEGLLENRVEEGIADAKKELTDYVEDQVDDAKDHIIKRIGQSSMSCSVNFDFS